MIRTACRTAGIIRGSITIAGAVLAPALLVVLLLHAGTRWWMPATLDGPLADGGWTARSRAWFTAQGFFPPEIEPDTHRQFSWTAETAHLTLPYLNRSRSYSVALEVAGPRPPDVAPSPMLHLFVDGLQVATTDTEDEPRRVTVVLPCRRMGGAVLTLQVSDTFLPGPHDPRPLGIVVTGVSLIPEQGHLQPVGRVAARASLATLLCALGLLLCGLRSRLAVIAAAAIAVTFSWLLIQDGAFIGSYVDRLVNIGLGVALAGAVVGLARWRWPATSSLPEWPTAAGLVLAVSGMKLAFFAHPLATVGDAIFQVHRAEWVHAGRYFFTSVTPSPFFEFPYAIGLYVTALPFWEFFPTKLDLARLLRGLTLGADALAGLALYAAARRQWNDRGTALFAVVLWLLSSASFRGLCNANLTNVFGQSLYTVAMAGIAWNAAGVRTSFPALAATCVVLTMAFLSHFGTLLIGVPLVCAVSGALMMAGRTQARRAGVWALILCFAAVAVSYGVYYSQFHDVFRGTIERLASGEADTGTGRSLSAPVAEKFTRWIRDTSDDYGLPGLPLLLAAVAGVVFLVRQRPREALTLILAGWTFVWLGFSAVGVLSAVQIRVNLAAAPVFVLLAAYALGWIGARSRQTAMCALVAALVIGWDGVREWLMCVGRP